MSELYPLAFTPVFKDYPWGGRNLAARLGREIPPGKVAESWEIAAHPSGTTRVARGAFAGRPLDELMVELGERLVGRHGRAALESGRFPLLIKLLDANEWLSVQVHPDDAFALEHESDLGKSEMWVILHAESGAELIYGLKEGTTVESFRAALDQGRAPERLHRVPVRTGDVFYVPTGCVHALGPGAIVAEIQQNSDTTYRLYDWGRMGNDGRPRPLHLDRGLEVIDWTIIEPGAVSPEPLDGGRELLARSPYFITERLHLAPGHTFEGDADGRTLELWALLDGAVTLNWEGGAESLDAVTWRLIPAALGRFTVRADAPATLLRVTLPEGTAS